VRPVVRLFVYAADRQLSSPGVTGQRKAVIHDADMEVIMDRVAEPISGERL